MTGTATNAADDIIKVKTVSFLDKGTESVEISSDTSSLYGF